MTKENRIKTGRKKTKARHKEHSRVHGKLLSIDLDERKKRNNTRRPFPSPLAEMKNDLRFAREDLENVSFGQQIFEGDFFFDRAFNSVAE